MQAIIMAGGEGTRLRPLTEYLPKPLIPLLDEPAAGCALQLLRRHGIREATMTLRCRAEQIRCALGDGTPWGVSLTYAEEAEPLGTAGSVKQAARAGKTLLVMSSDVLTDCDLSAMIAHHRQSGAVATVALTEVDHPAAYGVCRVDEAGRIVRFVEKPGREAPLRGLVNAGIYLLEPSVLAGIPANVPWDFGRDVFPRLIASGARVCGYFMRGYWRDIGCPEQYARAQEDFLMGRVGLTVRGRRAGRAILAPGAVISPGAKIAGRCYIGANARIGAGAVIGPGTVISRGARVLGGVHIEHACLWPDARAEGDAILRGVVVMPVPGNATLCRMAPYPVPDDRNCRPERGLTAAETLHIMRT